MTKGAYFYVFGLGVLLGVGGLHQLPHISVAILVLGGVIFALGVMGTVFMSSMYRGCRWIFVLCSGLGLAWVVGGAQIYERVQQQLPAAEEDRIFRLQLQVQTLPEVRERSLQFIGRVISARPNEVPDTVQLRWFAPDWAGPYQQPAPYEFPEVLPGEIWQVTAVLRTPYGALNPYGFDSEQFAFAQGVRALATVRGTPERLAGAGQKEIPGLWRDQRSVVSDWPQSFSWLAGAQRWRAQLKAAMTPWLQDHYWGKVILALTIGDRSEFTDGDWELFNRAGLTHLISISGTHITLVAGSMGALALGLLRRLPITRQYLLARQPAAVWAGVVTLVVAALYSAVAGWGVPARRSFFMLAIIVVGYLSRISLSIGQLLMFAAVLIVLFDPWAMLSTGFWLSFGAVATLLACAVWSGESLARDSNHGWSRRLHLLFQFVLWQAVITVLLWPLLVWFFAEFSVASVVSNLYAITMLGTIATPLSLLFALSAVVFEQGWVTHGLLNLALWCIEWTMRPTQWLVAGPWAALEATQPPIWVVVSSFAGLAIAMAPRFWSGQRWFWLAVLPVLFWPQQRLQTGEWALDVLDVGQGLAVIIRTRQHTYLYDVGRRSSPLHDEGQRVVLPHLQALGVKRLEGIIISHADLDHIGGLRSVLEALPVNQLYGSFPFVSWWQIENKRLGGNLVMADGSPELTFCKHGLEWEVDGVKFRFLWPITPLADIGAHSAERNASSCVLEIRGAHDRALLLGDINAEQERDMFRRGWLSPQSLVITAHHGSRHASGVELINATQPCYAISAVGWWNRFGHPHPDTEARWLQAGTALLNTRDWGAVRFVSRAHTLSWQAQRWHHRRYWHHPQSIQRDSATRQRLKYAAQRCAQR